MTDTPAHQIERFRMSALIGQAALTGGELETRLRLLHQQLAGPGPARELHRFAGTVDILVRQCQAMLDVADLTEEVRILGREVLGAAKAAYIERNRLVHGSFSSVPEASDVFRVRFEKGGRVTEADWTPRDVEAVTDALSIALARLAGLLKLAGGDLGPHFTEEAAMTFLRGEVTLLFGDAIDHMPSAFTPDADSTEQQSD